MELFTNLPGFLRSLFGILRMLSVLLSVFWLFAVLLGPWVTNRFQDKPNLVVAIGEVSLPVKPGMMEMKADSAPPGSLALNSLQGSLQMDLGSNDPALISAARLTLIPAVVVFAIFSWVMFGSLRCVCANIERGEVFSERNLRLVRGIGMALIAYSLAGVPIGLWSSYVISGYLNQHVVLTGFGGGLQLPVAGNAMLFQLSTSLSSSPGGLVTGCLVLVVAEAFRQGLNLKTENDLTV